MFVTTLFGQHGSARDCTEQCGHEQHHGDRGGCNDRSVRPVAERSRFGQQRPRSTLRGLFCFLDLFKIFSGSPKSLAGGGGRGGGRGERLANRQPPPPPPPPGKALARRVGVKSGDWTAQLL